MMTRPILILTTSHDRIGDTGRATGFYWEELAVPYWALRDAGHAVVFASPKGGMPPADPSSARAEGRAPAVQRFLDDPDAMHALAHSLPVADAKAADYAGVFLPGGHGTMWDMSQTPAVGQIVGQVFDAGGVVGAVCHGPAGLLEARLPDGTPIVAGRRVNGFTDAEERAVGLADVVPYLLESRLRALGGLFEGNPSNFGPHAVRDGRLVTGQNPASSAAVARLLVAALADQARKAA
jgi:putative intracellular protease/amidase